MRQPREETTLLEFYRQLTQGFPLVDGLLVNVSADATTGLQQVRHGLGRVYRGAWPVLGPDQATQVRILYPTQQDEPETYVYYQLSTATACNIRLWVW